MAIALSARGRFLGGKWAVAGILRRPLTSVWRTLALSMSFFFIISFGLLVVKFYEDSMRARERGRLTSSIVSQQFRQIQADERTWGSRPSGKKRADGSVDLSPWMTRETFLESDPKVLLNNLKTQLRHRLSSQDEGISFKRWETDLGHWRAERFSGDAEVLSQARENYFQASGFSKVGRSYDATVLNLWTIRLLTDFIEKNSFDGQVPEALFMLGVAYRDLDHALPTGIRRDRILNLCSELYSDSLWANRANMIWREGASNEI